MHVELDLKYTHFHKHFYLQQQLFISQEVDGSIFELDMHVNIYEGVLDEH